MKDAELLGEFSNCQQLKRRIAEYFSCIKAALTVPVFILAQKQFEVLPARGGVSLCFWGYICGYCSSS